MPAITTQYIYCPLPWMFYTRILDITLSIIALLTSLLVYQKQELSPKGNQLLEKR